MTKTTVQLIHVVDYDAQGGKSVVHSFVDNKKGNEEANEKFFELVKKYGYDGDAEDADEFRENEKDYWGGEDGERLSITKSVVQIEIPNIK